MKKIRRMARWIMRMGHSRGFGVQSPSAYGFIRYVINEHYPYYAYEDLKLRIADIDSDTRKLCRLYFRIANYAQAGTCLDYAPSTQAYAEYIRCGCRKTNVKSIQPGICGDAAEAILTSTGSRCLLRISPEGRFEDFATRAVCHADESTILILEGIRKSRKARQLWEQLITDERISVTFDLYCCGILFFDTARTKQDYIVNF